MGCTSAKQVSAVPNGEEAQNKSYSNGDLLSGQCTSILSFSGIQMFAGVKKNKKKCFEIESLEMKLNRNIYIV